MKWIFVGFLLWIGGFFIGWSASYHANKPTTEYIFGAEYNISVLKGFEDIELTIPRNHCGPTIIIQNWITEEDCK